jgi:hypothetical protein
MPTITSRVHSETVSSVLRLVADWTAGIWDLSSLAFTIPTGLAGHRTTTLSSLPAFRTCYGPRCLSAQGQSRDLQHGSPMLARCGNIALPDIAHMGVGPIQSNVPHRCVLLLGAFPGDIGSLYNGWETARPSNHRLAQECCRRSAIFLYRSSRVETEAFPQQSLSSRFSLLSPWSRGLTKILTYKETDLPIASLSTASAVLNPDTAYLHHRQLELSTL